MRFACRQVGTVSENPPDRAPSSPAAPGLIAGNGRSIGELVALLSRMVSAPVVDETKLTGVYDLELEWTAQLNASAEQDLSIFTALREQLGLQLDPIRAQVDTIVVEGLREQPTAD